MSNLGGGYKKNTAKPSPAIDVLDELDNLVLGWLRSLSVGGWGKSTIKLNAAQLELSFGCTSQSIIEFLLSLGDCGVYVVGWWVGEINNNAKLSLASCAGYVVGEIENTANRLGLAIKI